MVGRIHEETTDGNTIGLIVECPECDHLHIVKVEVGGIDSERLSE